MVHVRRALSETDAHKDDTSPRRGLSTNREHRVIAWHQPALLHALRAAIVGCRACESMLFCA